MISNHLQQVFNLNNKLNPLLSEIEQGHDNYHDIPIWKMKTEETNILCSIAIANTYHVWMWNLCLRIQGIPLDEIKWEFWVLRASSLILLCDHIYDSDGTPFSY